MPYTDQQLMEKVFTHFKQGIEIKHQMMEKGLETLLDGANLIANTLKSGGKVMLCGNGGSAADCQHMAAEFVNCLTKDFPRPGLPAIALTTDTSFLTAYANDCNFEGVFARQVEVLGKPNDLLIGISTSGNSPNIVQAVRTAQLHQIHSLVLTGAGGELAKIADLVIQVPCNNTQQIQEIHLVLEHLLCELAELILFSS